VVALDSIPDIAFTMKSMKNRDPNLHVLHGASLQDKIEPARCCLRRRWARTGPLHLCARLAFKARK